MTFCGDEGYCTLVWLSGDRSLLLPSILALTPKACPLPLPLMLNMFTTTGTVLPEFCTLPVVWGRGLRHQRRRSRPRH